MMRKLKIFWGNVKNAMILFMKNDPLRMAGATAFFTIFALPPILIIIVQIFSFIINPETIKHELFVSLSGIFGQEAVRQIVSVIRAFRKMAYNWAAAIAGFLFLIFVATTLFKVIGNSINQIWNIRHSSNKKPFATLLSRLESLLVILTAGLLFSIAIFVETLQVFVGKYFFKFVPSASGLFNEVLAFIISTFIVAVWFLIVFRYIPASRPRWRPAWTGALFTSLLFSIGKIVLHLLLTYNNVTTIYGASASIVLLLLFVFYSAMILYYGAAFTRILELKKNDEH
jgi:membrane protein